MTHFRCITWSILIMSFQRFWFFSLFLVLALSSSGFAATVARGGIFGKVVDGDTGESLVGVVLRLDPVGNVAFSDVNGSYLFANLEPGQYSIVAVLDGFSNAQVNGVEVKPGESTKADVQMGLAAFHNTMVVTAETSEASDLSLLKHRQKSVSVSDAIGAEMISKSGGGSAADAVSKITGASVVGGKYLFVRGLGGRYTSTHLNGVELPTADPDVKAFQADLFPSGILEKVVAIKSFTPDKPGNFSGGIVDIGTRDYPQNFQWQVGGSMGYDTVATGNDNFLSYPGSGSDWMGRDDGLRALPDLLDGGNLQVPNLNTARFNEEEAQLLDQVSKAFEPVMSPSGDAPPMNQSISASVGNRFPVFGRDMGMNFSFSYGRSYKAKEDQTLARWKLTENADVAGSLINQSDFVAQSGQDKVTWGGLFSLNYLVTARSELTFNFIYNQGGESQAQYYVGSWPEQFSSDNAFLESRVLKYTERRLNSFQLKGEHVLDFFGGTRLEWLVADSTTSMDQPDTRIFTNNFSRRVVDGEETTVYSINPSNYNHPARYYRDLTEDGTALSFNVSIPFSQWGGRSGSLKFGAARDEKNREFNELRFEYRSESNVRYEGDPDQFFGLENMGLFGYDEDRRRYIFGNVIQLSPDPRGGNYTGDETVDAYFGMVELPLSQRLKLVAGARHERVDMVVGNEATTGVLDDEKLLPSFNLITELHSDSNLRLSYGKTLARPTFREKAPYSSYDFLADGIFVGNPDLQTTFIDNYDLRYEWFPRSGEIIAASLFYKEFENPIEKAYNVRTTSDFGETTYLNVDQAEVQGIELEVRKRLDGMVLNGTGASIFTVSANVSFIDSNVDIPEEEYQFILQRDPNASPTRELQGQSDFIANLAVHYDQIEWGTSASLIYNLTGTRLDEVGVGGAPNAYEQARGELDFTFFQDVRKDFIFKFVAKNLLDEDIEITQDFNDVSYSRLRYAEGRSFSLGFSYKP
jgi:TonB-dependent receptor